ncbi:hypothetical protein [Nocardioides sp. 503]|uniref:hypothetical protein n=1 Tax=Nocardioides sp. 503 TaxID=2508326 RepID=UPI00106F2095|nr:hypothetical protein [Nocardioides sp. 503]
MFIRTDRGYFNLHLVVNYRRDDRTGAFRLVFAVDGGNVTIDPGHPQYRQVERHLAAATLGPDTP